MSQTFRAITTGVMILGLGLPALAFELNVFIHVRPLSQVREVCALEAVPEWGCVIFKAAVDDPTDFICVMVIPFTDYPWEEERLLEPLRLQCLEGAGR